MPHCWREIGKRDLGLDHPELCQVAPGVRILGAKGRPKGVDLGRCQAVGLDVELPRDRQKRLAAKEILSEIDLTVRDVRGRLARSRVDTRNNAPAPSASSQ